MAKRILILSSSPRKGGNSDTLCDEFLRGAKEAGNDVEIVRIPDSLHSFLMLPPNFEHVQQTYQIINAFLNKG